MKPFDPFDPDFFRDPYPHYEWLRRESPVHRMSDPDYHLLSRHADIVAAASDHATYSSAAGVLIGVDSSQLPVNLMNMDPPRHDELRAVLTRALTDSSVARLEPIFRRHAIDLIEGFRSRGECEFVAEFARDLPSRVIADVLEIDPADREDFLRWNHAVNAGSEFVGEGALSAYEQLEAYFRGVIAERRDAPGDDLVSRIFRASQSETKLRDEEVLGFCTLLLVAGQHASINLMTHAMIELERHPDQRRLLRERPELLRKGAVEELMRFISPVQGLARTTTREVELHGVKIPAQSPVLLLFASGNRDPARFEDPDRLDVTRPENRTHLGFGHGIHYCLGNAVARLETRVALEELLARLPDWEVDLESVDHNQLIPGRGVGRAMIGFGKNG